VFQLRTTFGDVGIKVSGFLQGQYSTGAPAKQFLSGNGTHSEITGLVIIPRRPQKREASEGSDKNEDRPEAAFRQQQINSSRDKEIQSHRSDQDRRSCQQTGKQ